MSDDEHKMPGCAEGGLPAKLAPKEQPQKLPIANSASQEENSEIQERVNTLSQALKQSMAVYENGIQEQRTSTACLFGGSKFQNVAVPISSVCESGTYQTIRTFSIFADPA